MHTAVSDGFANNFFTFFIGPSFVVNKCVFNYTHEADLITIFFDQFRYIISLHTSLEYVNTHLDHIRYQCSSVAVRMMYDIIYAVALVIAVDLFIGIQEEIFEHSRTEECAVMAAPVVMMEDHIRVKMVADAFCQF